MSDPKIFLDLYPFVTNEDFHTEPDVQPENPDDHTHDLKGVSRILAEHGSRSTYCGVDCNKSDDPHGHRVFYAALWDEEPLKAFFGSHHQMRATRAAVKGVAGGQKVHKRQVPMPVAVTDQIEAPVTQIIQVTFKPESSAKAKQTLYNLALALGQSTPYGPCYDAVTGKEHDYILITGWESLLQHDEAVKQPSVREVMKGLSEQATVVDDICVTFNKH